MKQKRGRRARARFVAYVAASADGRISLTERTPPDWTSKEDWRFLQKELARAEAVVVGRNTYEAATARLRRRITFVFSRHIKRRRQLGTVTFLDPHRVDLQKLFRPYRKVAILGGGGIYNEMREQGLMDELYITVEPLIFGRGKEMFIGGTRTEKLQLISVKRLNKKGTLLLRYRIKRKSK